MHAISGVMGAHPGSVVTSDREAPASPVDPCSLGPEYCYHRRVVNPGRGPELSCMTVLYYSTWGCITHPQILQSARKPGNWEQRSLCCRSVFLTASMCNIELQLIKRGAQAARPAAAHRPPELEKAFTSRLVAYTLHGPYPTALGSLVGSLARLAPGLRSAQQTSLPDTYSSNAPPPGCLTEPPGLCPSPGTSLLRRGVVSPLPPSFQASATSQPDHLSIHDGHQPEVQRRVGAI